MRIVYIIDTLSTKGGAERIISEKMNYMATRYGYDVSIITCYQFPDSMPNCYYLSKSIYAFLCTNNIDTPTPKGYWTDGDISVNFV